MHTANRRIRILRSKRKALALARIFFPYKQISLTQTEADLVRFRQEWSLHMYQNRKSCSCAMCCNPRRSPFNKGIGRLSMQERKALAATQDQMQELALMAP